jgi:predicted amidohydrolase
MNILLAQIKISNNYNKNFNKICSIIKNYNFNILVFPELSLTSYNLKKTIHISNENISSALNEIQTIIKSKQIVIVGTIVHLDGVSYNASAIISSKSINYYYKNTLTKYDSKYFLAGKNKFIFRFKTFKIGILICRDQDDIKLIESYKKEKCDILIHQSAHYYMDNVALEKLDKNNAMPIIRAIDSGCLFCKVNTVGKNNKKVSLGSSMIVDKDGLVLRQANKYKEEIIKLNTKDIKW